MKFFTSGAVIAATSGIIAVAATTVEDDNCIPHSLPNPIWQTYPGNVTGTLNGTVAILPIPYTLARSIVPKEYGILKDAWRSLLPDLPKDMYPAIFQGVRDHNVRFGEFQMPDFSRASIEFPFIDLLGDGHTSFRWAPSMLLTSSHDMAIHGAREYGTNVYPATFEPSCNGYEHQGNSADKTYFRAQSVDSKSKSQQPEYDAVFSSNLSSLATAAATLPMSFFVNATNQPSFADGKVCDHYIRLYNGTLSTGENAALPVSATVRARVSDLFGDETMSWTDAVGVQLDTVFIENHMVSCESMRGYDGPGEQKYEVKGDSRGWSFGFFDVNNLQQAFTDYLISPIKQAVLS